jgi:hypothetical protein
MSRTDNKDFGKQQQHRLTQIRELSLSLLDPRERLIMWARKRQNKI